MQILDNLVGNAIKYCDKNKSDRVVKIKTLNSFDHFSINIEDNGIGIPPARQPEVFGMFKRFHDASIPGSGLGLYLVKKQINRLGARINFESSSEGTTFFIEFPLVKQQS